MSTIQVNSSQTLNVAVNQQPELSPSVGGSGSTAGTGSLPVATAAATQPVASITTPGATAPSVTVNTTVITGQSPGQSFARRCGNVRHQQHALAPNDNIRYALLGAVAFQPAPPPIAPRNETLPVVTPPPPATTPPVAQPSALESLQETVKTLTTTMMQMLDKLKEIISGVAANKTAASSAPQSSAVTSPSQPVGSPLPRGMKFEWRAHSGKDGKLVVLIPKSMNNCTDVKILSPDRTQVLGIGRKDGLTADKQAQVRFDQTGESYPAGSIVQFTDSSGKVWEVTIPNTSGRYQH